MNVGGTVVTVGGGVQLLQLPDINFTFITNAAGNTKRKQKNSELDDYGGAVSGAIETPLGYWGGTPVTGVVSGFFANVDSSDRRGCVSNAGNGCTVENIVDDPTMLDSTTFGRFTTKTDRDVDFWGVSAEARFGNRPPPSRDQGGFLFRFGGVGIGADVRGIDQDNRIRLQAPGAPSPAVRYNETLDTTYYGGFASVTGEFNILGYFGIGGNWGIRSFATFRGGIYGADTDYTGRYTMAGGPTTRLGLSDDEVAFIGSATFETRKQFGSRTSLSLLTDYEWYSYAPEMRYVDADRTPAGNFRGRVSSTHITDDDAFAVRTQLRLNIGLGPSALYAPPISAEPYK